MSEPVEGTRLEGRAKFVAAPLAALWGTVPGLLGFVAIGSVATITDRLIALGPNAIVVYAAIFALASGLGILPTYAMAMVGGWVFGVALGLPAAIAGYCGGAAAGFAVSRLAAGDGFRRWLDSKPRARAIREALVGRTFWRSLGVVILVRFPPVSPFALMNLAMAASGVRFVPYILGTLLGMAPRTAIAVVIAAQAAAVGERNLQDLFVRRTWETIAGVAVTVVVVMVLAHLGKVALRRAGLGDLAGR